MPAPSLPAPSFLDEVRAARRAEYAALLYAPASLREDMATIHAFDIELARIPLLAHQQIAAELRFQWWRDALAGSDQYEASANPLARAMRQVIGRYNLPLMDLHHLVDARAREIYDVPFAQVSDIETYGADVFGVLRNCAARILGATHIRLGHAAKAEGLVDVLMRFADSAARGVCLLPEDVLQACSLRAEDVLAGPQALAQSGKEDALRAVLADLRARASKHWQAAQDDIAAVPRGAKPAALTLTLVPKRIAYLFRHADVMYRSGDITPLRQVWTIWRAAR